MQSPRLTCALVCPRLLSVSLTPVLLGTTVTPVLGAGEPQPEVPRSASPPWERGSGGQSGLATCPPSSWVLAAFLPLATSLTTSLRLLSFLWRLARG